ncbi:MAG: cupin domain-containing protein [Variibacter sp.]|nr:cupin domain-containing protein [Variibacter sp.]
MGRVVTFSELPNAAAGVARAPITQGETREMSAEHLRIAPGQRFSAQAPAGCDHYLFALEAGCAVAAAGERHALPAQTFVTLGEGVSFTVENAGSAPAQLVLVTAPPAGGRQMPGFAGRIAVAERARTAIVPVPEDHKKRLYFVGGHGAKSERGHAMIVVYDGETNTPLHYHPDADSLFVLLDGAVEFTVNGAQVVVKPGQAAYFPTGDRHGLHTAPGYHGASFLEFHIPAKFSTVKA